MDSKFYLQNPYDHSTNILENIDHWDFEGDLVTPYHQLIEKGKCYPGMQDKSMLLY